MAQFLKNGFFIGAKAINPVISQELPYKSSDIQMRRNRNDTYPVGEGEGENEED
ncbi:uncharacterized protein G2W53_003485 [Senna tora]|uniref:Uncharacterized protein n=1 Tax=Senna tora TaxID=362788 RepID=A0A835CJB1_9FABA|nr:uncharacterized protein G2W53_003485 [Senna tora]